MTNTNGLISKLRRVRDSIKTKKAQGKFDSADSGLYSGLIGFANLLGLGNMIDKWVDGKNDKEFTQKLNQRLTKDAALRQRALNYAQDLITKLETASMGVGGNAAVKVGKTLNKVKKDYADMSQQDTLIRAVEENLMNQANAANYDNAIDKGHAHKSITKQEEQKNVLQKPFNEKFESYIR